MFKLLIVDDEEFVRNGLANLLIWQKMGFDDVRVAADGFEALKAVDRYKPNVVITDIRMPNMDGLQLSKQIRIHYPSILIVILSAYDEFEYAKQAISNGVKGYLLKPLKEMELIEVFTRIKEELTIEKTQKDIDDNSAIAKKEVLIKEIIKGVPQNGKSILKDLNNVGVNLSDKYLRIAVCSFDLLYLTPSRQSEFQFIINATREFCDKNSFPAVLYMGYMVSILNSETVISKTDAAKIIRNYISYIEAAVEAEYGLQLSMAIGIGNLYKGIEDIPQSYGQALYAISGQYPKENCSVVFYQDLNIFSRNATADEVSVLESHDMEGIVSSIINDIFSYNIDALTKNIHTLFGYIEQDNMHLLEDTKLKLMEIIFLVALKLKDKGIHIGTFNKLRILKAIESFSRFSDLKIWFKDELKQFSEDINKNRESSLKDSVWYIEKAKAYIKTEYDKRITLDDISKFLHLNPVYFSISFKKKTGQNFIDYVNSVKIIKAEEFLLRPEHKVKEVALMVGYDDYSYFCKVFRKITGTTPVEYRARNHN